MTLKLRNWGKPGRALAGRPSPRARAARTNRLLEAGLKLDRTVSVAEELRVLVRWAGGLLPG